MVINYIVYVNVYICHSDNNIYDKLLYYFKVTHILQKTTLPITLYVYYVFTMVYPPSTEESNIIFLPAYPTGTPFTVTKGELLAYT